jgi:hypothetical protein
VAKIDEIVSKIPKIRAQGEKRKVPTLMGLPLVYPSCEVCGKVALSDIQCPYCGRWVGVTTIFYGHKTCWDTTYGCCRICSNFIKEQLSTFEESPQIEQKTLDPYLVNIKEKFHEVAEFFKGKRFSWAPVVILMFEAVMLTLQRMVVDKKGVTTLEELRKQKKLYFDTLVNILEKEGLKLEDVKDLEILKDLRNKVEHEGFKPSKEEALWSYSIVKNFISKYYPQIFFNEENPK